MLNKQEKTHKIAWIADPGLLRSQASQIVADPKGNAFIVEKISKIAILFTIIIVI